MKYIIVVANSDCVVSFCGTEKEIFQDEDALKSFSDHPLHVAHSRTL